LSFKVKATVLTKALFSVISVHPSLCETKELAENVLNFMTNLISQTYRKMKWIRRLHKATSCMLTF